MNTSITAGAAKGGITSEENGAGDLPPLPKNSLAARLAECASNPHYTWHEYVSVMQEASDVLHAITKWAEGRAAIAAHLAAHPKAPAFSESDIPADAPRAFAKRYSALLEENRALKEKAAAHLAKEPKVEQPAGWINVDDALPAKYCFAVYKNRAGKQRIIRAMYVRQYEVEATGDECDSEYNEVDDREYLKAGWMECIDNWSEYSSVYVCEGEVTHWMPLPALPGEVAVVAPAGTQNADTRDLAYLIEYIPDEAVRNEAKRKLAGAQNAPEQDLLLVLREFVDYHTKPAGMTVETALDSERLGDFLAGVEAKEKSLVERAKVLLAAGAQNALPTGNKGAGNE